jgi:hypothetical protein
VYRYSGKGGRRSGGKMGAKNDKAPHSRGFMSDNDALTPQDQ